MKLHKAVVLIGSIQLVILLLSVFLLLGSIPLPFVLGGIVNSIWLLLGGIMFKEDEN